MNHFTIKKLVCLILLGLITLNLSAEGLSEYLQNPEATPEAIDTPKTTNTVVPSPQNNNIDITPSKQPDIQIQNSSQLKNIIELVVAGIVAAAMIIVILVIFLGKFLTSKEKKLIKVLRMEAEENTEQISTVANAILEQGKETTQITQTLRDHAEVMEIQQQQSEQYSKEIADTSLQVKQTEHVINEVTVQAKDNMEKIQKYWDNQVSETVDTIGLFQHKLNDNINVANEGLERINEQKELSSELLQDFLSKHNQQSALIDNNSEISNKVSANLMQAHDESNKLLELLKSQQEQAERSLNEYSQRLHSFEEQAYEQFDTSFQVADLARQELSANIDENRKHIKTMRHQEEQSHGLNNQIAKNLESLDYSKIVKISQTLNTTQNMFNDIHHKVDETRDMLGELKEIEEEIKQTASNVKHVAESHAVLDHHEAEIDQKITGLIEVSETRNIESFEKDTIIEDEIVERAEVEELSEKVRENTTVAITDYRMASGDTSTPLSFFRDIQKNSPK